MKLIVWYRQWRMNITVGNLNKQAAYFGFGPMTEQQWIDGLKRIQPIVKMSGLSMQEMSVGFNNFSKHLNAHK